MKKFLLIASVAAIAVTAPAQAERGGHKGEQQNSQAQAQPTRGGGGGGGQRAERAQVQQSRPQRAERMQVQQARPQRIERQQVARQQPVERRARQVETRQARPQFEQRARVQEAHRAEQARGRAVAQERVDARRVQQARNVDNQDRANRQRTAVAERQAARMSGHDAQRQVQVERRADHRAGIQSMQADRQGRFQRQAFDRQSVQQAEVQRNAQVEQMTARRAAFSGDDSQWRQREWQQRAERQRALAELRDRRFERLSQATNQQRIRNDFFRVGQRVDSNWWYDDYVPLRYRSNYADNSQYYYRTDGDYLYRLNRNDNIVSSLFPLLGGAYSVGQPMPFYYDTSYNVPYGYNSLYYDTPDSYYRYGDGAIYGVNPTTQLITGIVALLTGQNFGVGQQLPMGYDVYNVPYQYRSSYYDTPDMMYRYDDGYIYGVDPRSRMIETSYPVYGGYTVGNQWPTYAAGYDYDVPDYYDDLYYNQPGYDYRYASGGIYQVDPKTQLIAALAALVTGQNFNVGQQLPLGYDTYNVPFAYRDQYYDTNDNMYRYADGRIVQVDPNTRLIRQVIMV